MAIDVFTTAELLAAGSLITAVVGYIVGTFYSYRLVVGNLHPEAVNLAIGVVLASYAWSLHRTYWLSNRLIEASGEGFVNNWLYPYRILTLIPFVLVVVGYGYHLRPVLYVKLGEYCIAKYMGLIGLLFFVTLVLVHNILGGL